MQAMDLMRKGDSIIRVLKIKDEKILIIDCLKQTMPVWMLATALDGYVEIEDDELYKATGFAPVDVEKLDAEDRRMAYKRYTVIAGVLPFLENEKEKGHAINSAATCYDISKQTVRAILCRYLTFQSISALAPLKREHEEILSEDQKNMRWALNKFFYTTKRYPLSLAYALMLKEKYCDAEGKLIPDHPSIHQFRYFYKTHRKMQNLLISRNGLTDYQRNSRPLLGDGVQEFAPVPGTAMLDSTILDVFLVDEAGKLVGRPILTAAVDAYSSMCVGYALTFEGGVYSLRKLMQNVITDKKQHCREHGIRIMPKSWDCCGVLPGKIVTDMGGEYVSETFSQLAELGTTIINLPPYRPELKGPAEKFFDCVQNLYKPILKGKGIIEPNYHERGAHDYRKDACLTLEEFEKILIQCIVYYNSHRVLESFPYTEDMLEKQIQPYASAIWDYGRSLPGTNLIPVSMYRLMLTLLPRTEGRFTRTGLVANGMRYKNDGFKEWYLRGGLGIVAYDPDDVSMAWLVEKGDFIPLEMIESRYRDKPFSEVSKMKTRQRNVIREAAERNQQARIDLIDHIQTIAATGRKYGDVDIRGVREARKKARREHHSDMIRGTKHDE